MKAALALACFVGIAATAAAAPTRPADFDGDGKTDMVSYSEASGEWFIRFSSSNFSSSVSLGFGGQAWRAVNGDFDGDGKADLAIYQPAIGAWQIQRSSDNTVLHINWGGPEYMPVPGDYDGDGTTDIAVYNRTTGAWNVLNSTTSFTTSFAVNWGGPGYAAVPADYDGDGRSDVAVYQGTTGWWYVLTSSSAYVASFPDNWGGPGYTPVPADFDGDGRADLVVYRPLTGQWHIKTSSSGYTTATVKNWGGTAYEAAPGDYDGDGHADLAVFHRSSVSGQGTWNILLSNALYTTAVSGQAGSSSPYSYAVLRGVSSNATDLRRAGDFDGDGKSDLVVYSEASGSWIVLTSSSNFTTTVPLTLGGPGFAAAPGDYDGDGRMDPAVFNGTTGAYTVLTSTSNYTTTVSRTFSVSSTGTYRFTYVAAPGDYDGDGRTDMTIFGGSYGIAWLTRTAASAFNSTTGVAIGGTGITYWPAAPADFSGRGVTDPAAFQQLSTDFYKGNWFPYWLRETGGPFPFTSIPWGGAGCVPLPADYDGDGFADLTMYCPSFGRWYILTSSSGFTKSILVDLGTSTSTPVSGDYDGDGRADPAVYEPSTGVWTIALSSTGYATTITRTLGGPGFVPLPTFPDPVGHQLPPNCPGSTCT